VTGTTFAATLTLSTGSYVIFAVAAFFALCAVIAWFVASALENGRRDAMLRADLEAEFAARTDQPGEATVIEEEAAPHRLQWPDDGPPHD
jgi:hypothetical protein